MGIKTMGNIIAQNGRIYVNKQDLNVNFRNPFIYMRMLKYTAPYTYVYTKRKKEMKKSPSSLRGDIYSPVFLAFSFIPLTVTEYVQGIREASYSRNSFGWTYSSLCQ